MVHTFLKSLLATEKKLRQRKDIKAGTIPFGVGGAARGGLAVIKFLPRIGTGLQQVGGVVKGAVQAAILGGILAGGGFTFFPKLFKGARKTTQIVLGKPTGEEQFFTPLPEGKPELSIKEMLKIAAVGGLAGLLAAGVVIIPDQVQKFLDRREKKGNGEVPQAPEGLLEPLPLPADTGKELAGAGVASPVPITPETQDIGKVRRRKHKIKRLEPQGQKIFQSVRVIVNSNSLNRKYIREVCV